MPHQTALVRPLPIAAALALVLTGCAAPSEPTIAIEPVPLVSHIDFGVFEQDVFIERGLPGEVYRPTPEDARDMLRFNAPLYATAEPVEHDPTFSQPGPYPKGEPLGVTLQQWLAGRGAITYTCSDNTARLDGVFSALVPNALYTVWDARLDFEEGAIVGALELPAGARDGSQNSLRTDATGAGTYHVTYTPCNAPATGGPGVGATGSSAIFALAYHSDGRSYGASPGPFGSVSHIHLFGFAKTPQ